MGFAGEIVTAVSNSKGLVSKYMQTSGFRNFTSYTERKIEHMFVDSSGPVLTRLKGPKQHWNLSRNFCPKE